MSRYRVGGDPQTRFTRVPNDVIATLDDPMCLGILVWMMAHHPDKKVTQRDVLARFHIPHQVSYARLRRCWQALEDAGFLHTQDVPDRFRRLRKVTLRTWEPTVDHAQDTRNVIGHPNFGGPSILRAKRSGSRSTETRSGTNKDVDLRQENSGAATARSVAQCPLCRGTGTRRDNTCSRCAGVGQVAM